MINFKIGDRVVLNFPNRLGPGTVSLPNPDTKDWGPQNGVWVLWDNAINRSPTWIYEWEITHLDNSSQI